MTALASEVSPAAETPTETGGGVADSNFTAPSLVCKINVEEYQPQLQSKLEQLKMLYSDYPCPEMEVHESAPIHYRMRSEFCVWGTRPGETLNYVMFEKASAQALSTDAVAAEASASEDEAGPEKAEEKVEEKAEGAEADPPAAKKKRFRGKKGVKKDAPLRVVIESFPVASKLINELMALVMEQVREQSILKERLFQVNFHTSLIGEAMVTLLYHKKLDAEWEAAAATLRESLKSKAPSYAAGAGLHVIGRSRKQKINVDLDYVLEKMPIDGIDYVYRQHEEGEPVFGVVPPNSKDTRGDLLELYCGNCNFTVPLAKNFRQVVATEVSKSGVDAARYNLTANNIDNVFVARMSSEEFTETWQTGGARRRLAGLDLKSLKLSTLLVDPPRSGLDDETVKLLSLFDNVVYISCNPETLHANLKGVVPETHKIERMAAFDQFPYTNHLEVGVYLTRNK
eukprot:gene25748-11411_t